jgi:ribonuclease D
MTPTKIGFVDKNNRPLYTTFKGTIVPREGEVVSILKDTKQVTQETLTAIMENNENYATVTKVIHVPQFDIVIVQTDYEV